MKVIVTAVLLAGATFLAHDGTAFAIGRHCASSVAEVTVSAGASCTDARGVMRALATQHTRKLIVRGRRWYVYGDGSNMEHVICLDRRGHRVDVVWKLA